MTITTRGPGRPRGSKNRLTAEMRQQARAFSEEALEVLVGLMRGGDKRVSLSAAQEILNRAWGRPGSLPDDPVQGSDGAAPAGGNLQQLSNEALDERIRELLCQAGLDPPAGRKEEAPGPQPH